MAFIVRGFLVVLLFVTLEVARGENNNKTLNISNSVGDEEVPRHSQEYYVKAFNFMVNTKAFKNFTLADATKYIHVVEDWEYPKELSENFPYYLSGFDYEDRPVWVIEFGRYNVRRVIERGEKATADLEKYLLRFFLRVLDSLESRKEVGKDVTEIFLIADWEGLDFSQAAHLRTVSFAITILGTYLEILSSAVAHGVAINVSYPAQVALNIAKPFLGGFLNKLDFYGNNKVKWSGVLRRLLPESAIPTSYGGAKDYKPVKYYGGKGGL